MGLEENGIYCDCTVGGGGHLFMMIQKTKRARFIGIDWDPEAIGFARKRLINYTDRLILCEENFANLDRLLNKLNIKSINGVLFDLGASFYQLTTPHRGFSFNQNGMLLMQMSPHNIPLYQKIRSAKEFEIYRVLKDYGDVPKASHLAYVIFQNKENLKTTFDLRRLVEGQFSKRFLKKNLHRVFQAFRIWINDELNNLQQGLIKAIKYLEKKGRLVVIAYHSGEDRIVKQTMRLFEKEGVIKRLNKKVIRPSPTEIKSNPAARSALMRIGEKCGGCC